MVNSKKVLCSSSKLFLKYCLLLPISLIFIVLLRVSFDGNYVLVLTALFFALAFILVAIPLFKLKAVKYDHEYIYIDDLFQHKKIELHHVCHFDQTSTPYLFRIMYLDTEGVSYSIIIWPRTKFMFGLFAEDPMPESVKEFVKVLNNS